MQKAFDQGVARLRAEGIAEADTPELLVRRASMPSRVVLVGSAPEQGRRRQPPRCRSSCRFRGTPTSWAGMATWHGCMPACRSGPGPVGIRPAGLTGMGGIGKTQLAVEYVYRHRGDYPDGIFWIDAAGPLAEGFARLATDHPFVLGRESTGPATSRSGRRLPS